MNTYCLEYIDKMTKAELIELIKEIVRKELEIANAYNELDSYDDGVNG